MPADLEASRPQEVEVVLTDLATYTEQISEAAMLLGDLSIAQIPGANRAMVKDFMALERNYLAYQQSLSEGVQRLIRDCVQLKNALAHKGTLPAADDGHFADLLDRARKNEFMVFDFSKGEPEQFQHMYEEIAKRATKSLKKLNRKENFLQLCCCLSKLGAVAAGLTAVGGCVALLVLAGPLIAAAALPLVPAAISCVRLDIACKTSLVKVKELKSVVSDVQQNTMQRWGGTIADESRVSATQSKLDNFPSVQPPADLSNAEALQRVCRQLQPHEGALDRLVKHLERTQDQLEGNIAARQSQLDRQKIPEK